MTNDTILWQNVKGIGKVHPKISSMGSVGARKRLASTPNCNRNYAAA